MVLWILTLLPLLAWVYLLAFHGGFWRSDQYFIPVAHPQPAAMAGRRRHRAGAQ